MISASSSGRYPYRRASATSSRALATTGLRRGAIPVTETPRPRRNSTRTSSPQRVQRAEHGVGVDPQHRGQVPGWREPLTRAGLTLGDRPADRRSDLLMQRHQAGVINP